MNERKMNFIFKMMPITLLVLIMGNIQSIAQDQANNQALILTPKPSASPRINGAQVFGVRPGHPFLFTIPATGEKPVTFSTDGLPEGLILNKDNGRISGSVTKPGTYIVKLKATNKLGSNEREFRIFVGDRLALTPPMGWNSFNCYGFEVTQKNIEINAQALVTSDLINHGWSYVNVDRGWEGYKREGPFNGIVADETKFPDIQGLINSVHDLGLKFGIYHQPTKNSWDKRIGASSDDPAGKYIKYEYDWVKQPDINENKGLLIGKYLFHWNDAQQFASWGVDYLKYDWLIRNLPHAIEMSDALKNVNRDIVYSVCNGAGFTYGNLLSYPEAKYHAIGLSYITNLWRSGDDTWDAWESIVANGFTQNRWRELTGPGHWNDPDMMLLGWVGWGNNHPTRLTSDEQYSHMSLWCLLAAPLIIGCDLTKLDEFTLNLLNNDEVIEVDQDPLGRQGEQFQLDTNSIVLVKELEDGSKAVGFFNLGPSKQKFEFRLPEIGIQGKQKIRDLWRQKDLGEFEKVFTSEVNPHGVVFVKMTSVK